MSTPNNKTGKVEKRNLYLKIPDERKWKLKELARESNMTMETYVSAVLEEAIANGDLFTFVKKRLDSRPALAS